MPADWRVHKVKKGPSKNPPQKPREAASESQHQQPQHNTDSQQQNTARPTTSLPAETRPQEHHSSSASWILHDVLNVSDPLDLMFTAGAYMAVFLVVTLYTLRYIIGPLIGDYIDLPFVTMEEGKVGIVKEFNQNPVTVMWCMSAFTSFNHVLGLIMQERGGVVRLIRPPVAVFCFLFSGVIDMFRVEQGSSTQLTEYKHMRGRGRAENWACFQEVLAIGIGLEDNNTLLGSPKAMARMEMELQH